MGERERERKEEIGVRWIDRRGHGKEDGVAAFSHMLDLCEAALMHYDNGCWISVRFFERGAFLCL
jgi:hypothetical protein